MKQLGWAKRLSVLLGAVLLFLIGWGGSLQGQGLGFHPIMEYHLLTPIKEANKVDIDEIMKAYLGRSFWRVNLNKIQADLTRLDWVYKAEIKRQWPNRLLVSVQEQKPVVLWGDSALLNRFGEVFYPKEIQSFQDLVVLQGSQQNSRKLLKKLPKFQAQFLVLNWDIKKLTEQVDGVWKIEFIQAPTVLLGQADWQDKLNRFIRAYPLVKPAIRKTAEKIDLRYSNGFVIKQQLSSSIE